MNTIIPGMLMREGQMVAPFGVMGGHYQAMGHVELLTGIIDRRLDVQEALNAPRSFAHDDVLAVEPRFPPEIKTGLQRRGHQIQPPHRFARLPGNCLTCAQTLIKKSKLVLLANEIPPAMLRRNAISFLTALGATTEAR
jgi:gamma-glutamyltranspeptidase